LIALLLVMTVAVMVLSAWKRHRRRGAAIASRDDSRFRFETLVERSSDLIAVLDCDGRIAYVSPSVRKVLGGNADDYVGLDWRALAATTSSPVAAAADSAIFDRVLSSPGQSAAFDYSLSDRHGNEHHYEAVVTNLLDEPSMRGIVLNSRDITERVHLERESRDSEESFRMLFDDNPYPMWVFENASHQFLQVNDAACQQYGYSREEFADMTIFDIRPPDGRTELRHFLHKRDATRSGPAVRCHRTKDGRRLDVEVRAHQLTFEGQDATLVLAQDVTERQRLETALEHRAFHDPLTELPNRALFRDRVQHALETARRSDGEVWVMSLDLDGFKTVNETLGHAAGDELLEGVARRLQRCMRSGDTIARMGGDEFAVLLENASSDEAAALASRLLDEVRDPFTVRGQEIFLTVSVGIAKAQPVGDELPTRTQLLGDADLAMYRAKETGRDRFAVFEPQMRSRITQRLTLQTDLQHALARDQLRVYYQPTVRLDTLEIVGFEALLRWAHPERGLIPPSEFIPLAEDTGLIVPIGSWVLHEACRQLGHWRRTIEGYSHLGIAVNVSGRQLQDAPFVLNVREAVELAGLDPDAVTLEITESLLLDDADAIANQLHELKAFGVRLAIDDFGTGYSSLSYLSRFPLDVMKIDKSFVVGTPGSVDRQAMLRSIVNMGRSFHLSTLGEGIETTAELERVCASGCDLGQGFLFDRPLTADEATTRLANLRPVRFAPC
jgi:diguanylate cyclase (GGDEF)-like protein/PAS domain S-box-containing protein